MTHDPRPTLEYRTVQPVVGSAPHPAIVLLHGRGSNELDLLSLGHQLDPRLLVISPRAPNAFAPGSYYWYDLEAAMIGQPSAEDLQHSLDLVDSLVEDALSTMPIDPARLFVGGLSMGGAMTAAMLLMHAERLAGAMILSGYVPVHSDLPWRPERAVGKPVFQAHGLYDDILPLQFGRMSRDYLQRIPVELTYREYPMAHQVSTAELTDGAIWIRDLI